MGRAPQLRFGGTTQYPDSLLLAHKIGPHTGQYIAHKIIVADRPDIVTARFLTR
ncbi:hypothetical protein [Cutibacterium acnes]|uniref:hypothetical protein n=1 Tax=Cutibacterium acnes TaxID=1747 RepID=UPI0001F0BDA1|nr:hypothetical protein [Cutibacterium acnes]EFS86219.1 hypothetical protein HMPREF9603_02168 [Cutibacterium acnes HL001PA1]